MDEETKDIMRQQLELLKKINKHFLYQRIWSTVKYIIMAGLIVLGFFQLQPYIDSLMKSFTNFQGGIDSNQLQDFLRKGL